MSFPIEEYQTRLMRAQSLMEEAGLAALLLSTEPELRYFTGFLTRFWESPSRPWFLVVPATGKPIAVIPSIGAALMGQSWIDDIRTWRAPDLQDDGVGLLCETLREVAGRDLVGIPDGMETHIRMPWADLERLRQQISLTSDQQIMRRLRLIKSPAEVEKIRHCCTIAGRAFARVHEIAGEGITLSQVFRDFQRLCLEEGADFVPYLAGAAEPGGYADVISPATDRRLARGDVLMLDTGLVKDGYFCDYDRNFSLGPASQAVQAAHAKLINATHAAYDLAKPDMRTCDLFKAMADIVGADGESGRLGHGLGMQLTEWPSLIEADRTRLEPGMVLTLEPGLDMGDHKIMVHEENIVITETGAEWLSPPSAAAIEVL